MNNSNEDQKIVKDLVDDLNKKSIEELIYINYNPEHYVNSFTKKAREANENLLNEIKNLNNQFEEKKFKYNEVKRNIENCKNLYEEKEKQMKNLASQQKNQIESEITVDILINEMKGFIDEKLQKPRQKIIKDFLSKKIDFETFKNRFKDITLKYHFYTIVKDKLNLCK